MSQEFSLLHTLVALTKERDALEALLQITPESHQEQVARVLKAVTDAIEAVSEALARWMPV
jgi:hypothetical protein